MSHIGTLDNKPFQKFALPDGTKKNFYKTSRDFVSKQDAQKTLKVMKSDHKAWDKKIYSKIVSGKDKYGKDKFQLFVYSTEKNWMQGFRGKRFEKKNR
jgi:hypothetical protein